MKATRVIESEREWTIKERDSKKQEMTFDIAFTYLKIVINRKALAFGIWVHLHIYNNELIVMRSAIRTDGIT